MTKKEVLELLREQQDERGIANWKAMGKGTHGLKSFGIGLTRLRKIAKGIGRDPKLAAKLWNSNVYDAKVLGLLIDDPKALTREQAEAQVEQLNGGMLAHVFSSCDATLAKAPFALDVACEWASSKDETRRRCAYGLFYELSKKENVGDEAFWLERLARINDTIGSETIRVRPAMAGALIGIGKRSKKLNRAAIKIAKATGPIEFKTAPGKKCEPIDVLKHLTSDYLKKKLAG